MRHAYMILAHNQEDLLIKLVQSLDISDNDIYVHIDQRSTLNKNRISESVSQATIQFVDRVKVEWGGYSMIVATMILLKAATKTHHIYYHLLSGVDLPLKNIKEINAFYEDNAGKEFIRFFDKDKCDSEYDVRYGYKSYFRDKCGKTHNVWLAINNILFLGQKIFHIYDKSLKDSFYMGSQFWDITEPFALALLENEDDFRKKYRFASVSDEIFVQTFIRKTPFWNNLWKQCTPEGNGMEGNMRFIDFSDEYKGSPHTININDVDTLLKTGLNFARKFDLKNSDAIEQVLKQGHKG